jgi:hypothetical protein
MTQKPDLIYVTGLFSQWGYLKSKVYQSNPHMEEKLRETIPLEVSYLPREQLQCMRKNMFRRCGKRVQTNVEYFQHLL